jgi:hypothetical protein
MRLSARKARHLDVSEVIVFGVVSGPSLDVVAGVGAAVEERGHYRFFFVSPFLAEAAARSFCA